MRLLPYLAALLVLLCAPTDLGAAKQAPDVDYGASVFLYGHPATTERDLGLLTAAGFAWARVLVPWRAIERDARGSRNWEDLDRVVAAANRVGVRIIARVDQQPAWARADAAVENGPPDDPGDYAAFVHELAQRYGPDSLYGRVHALQVWNEPNLAREWGGARIDRAAAAGYVALLRQAYRAAKAANPDLVVATAGLSPTGVADGWAAPDDVYLSWMYEAGLGGHYDVLGAHAAGFGSPPEAEPLSDPRFPHESFYFRRVETLRRIMTEAGDEARQVWLLEFGWTTNRVHPDYAWYAVTPEQQADYLVRAYRYAQERWRPWLGVMAVWTLSDPTWTPVHEQYWWSITEPDGTPREAYLRLRDARLSGYLP